MLKIVSASIYGGKNVAFQQTITCPNSTMETLEKGVQSQHYVQNMFKVNNKNTRTTSVVLVFLLLTLNIFLNFF